MEDLSLTSLVGCVIDKRHNRYMEDIIVPGIYLLFNAVMKSTLINISSSSSCSFQNYFLYSTWSISSSGICIFMFFKFLAVLTSYIMSDFLAA